VERGFVKKEFFYLPKDLVENYEKTVNFKISEEEIKKKYTNKGNLDPFIESGVKSICLLAVYIFLLLN
jgi:hypothetical protein